MWVESPAGRVREYETGVSAMTGTYLYEIDKKFLPVLALFGLRSKKDGVHVAEDGQLSASFGWIRLDTTLSNVDEAHVTS